MLIKAAICNLTVGLLWGALSYLNAESAQAQAAEEPPVPYITNTHSIPANSKNHKVFLDRSTGDAYVLWQSDDQNPSRLIPFALSTHIDPSIRVKIAYDALSQRWQYGYTFANGASARQSALSWYMKNLTPDICSVSVPEGWFYEYPTMGDPPWPRLVISAGGSPGRGDLGIGVSPGREITGPVIKSNLAPGLGIVYAQGLPQALALPGEPDDETARQLQLVLGFPYNFKSTHTLTPRIPMAQEELPAAYRREIQSCEREGLCSHEFEERAAMFLSKATAKPEEKKQELDILRTVAKTEFDKEFTEILRILFSN